MLVCLRMIVTERVYLPISVLKIRNCIANVKLTKLHREHVAYHAFRCDIVPMPHECTASSVDLGTNSSSVDALRSQNPKKSAHLDTTGL